MDPSKRPPRPSLNLAKPLSRIGLFVLVLVIATAPATLFFDPAEIAPLRRGHIPREPRSTYRLYSDDVAYVAASRTWDRAVANLFVPHNTHIVPVWRMITWSLVALAGRFESLPEVLALASYCVLTAVMLATGAVAARESGKAFTGLLAMAAVGTTSLLYSPATWYSAGQPLWAGLGILSALWYAQTYRRSASPGALILSGVSAVAAGWCWTIGHMAGPVAAVYLAFDGRKRCRWAALVPFSASVLAAATGLVIGRNSLDSTISFHGRTVRQAFNPLRGLSHTLQAIPENLIFGNLGLSVHTTASQGIVLTLGLLILWLARPGNPRFGKDASRTPRRRFEPLECAGITLIAGAYLVEWSFRGYLEYRFLRTLNLRFIVPWYDAIPQIGLVLTLAGWRPRVGRPTRRLIPLTRRDGLVVLALSLALVLMNKPRVDALLRASFPPMLPSEIAQLPTARLQTMRASALLGEEAEWQHAYLLRLDMAESVARRLGVGREGVREAVGHPWVPGSIGLLSPKLYDLYDSPALLNIPETGRAVDPRVIRDALEPLLAPTPPPRPVWIDPSEPWPPPSAEQTPP